MLESAVENYLTKRVRKLGGQSYKFVSPGNAGVPDRIILLPGGQIAFVEMKAPGKKATPKQLHQIRKIKNLGQVALVIDCKEGVDEFIREVGVTR